MATVSQAPVDHTKDSGYRMIDSIQIKNFRGFHSLQIHGLKRINVIAGDSGSGKTAFLEAIFMAGGSSPELYMRLRQWRGLIEIPLRIVPSRRGYESLFRELFFDFNQNDTASVSFVDSLSGPRSLTIKYKPDGEYSMSLEARETSPLSMVPLQFKWKVGNKTHDGVVHIKDGRLTFIGFQEVYPVWLIMPAATDPVAEHFSELSKRKQHLPIVEAIRAVFPAISALSLESIAGQVIVCASVDYLPEKLPVGMISGGISKYLWILTAIASNPGGAILIDEIESGLYFKSLRVILGSIVKFAEEQHVQIFATTHSAEFLEAIADVMEPCAEQFSFLRAERTDKECVLRVARGPSSIAAIHQHIELR